MSTAHGVLPILLLLRALHVWFIVIKRVVVLAGLRAEVGAELVSAGTRTRTSSICPSSGWMSSTMVSESHGTAGRLGGRALSFCWVS